MLPEGSSSTAMKPRTLLLLFLPLALLAPKSASADEPTPAEPAEASAAPPAPARDPYSLRPSVMVGLNQWLLFRGANIASQVKVGRFVIEYSHGQALHLDNIRAIGLTPAERDAGVSVEMTWTTGGGIGFQITPNLHVLVEAKAHRYEIVGADANQRLGYTTMTLGPGVFYDIYLYKGLFIQPSLRWWPTVASSYEGNHVFRTAEGGRYVHERHDLLPFVNLNVGWTFAGI
jgi:hypothetical protein